MFIIGGLIGISLGNIVMDLGLHDIYYVVAHFHFVLFLGIIIIIFFGIIFNGNKKKRLLVLRIYYFDPYIHSLFIIVI